MHSDIIIYKVWMWARCILHNIYIVCADAPFEKQLCSLHADSAHKVE